MSVLRSLQSIYRFVRPIIIKGLNNHIEIKSKRHNFIVRVYGNNNIIEIGENCRLKNTKISLMGDNNRVFFENGAKFDGPCSISLEGNSTLYVGTNSGVRGVNFVLRDGSVRVGRNCMFGYGILIRNSDSHKVLDSNGTVTNQPKDIEIGNHVWLCERCTILKGVTIGDDSIIALGAIVTKNCPPNSIMAGNPAQVVKKDINWLNK